MEKVSKQELVNHLNNGLSTGEISRLYAGTNAHQILYAIKQHGLKPNPQKRNKEPKIDWRTMDPILKSLVPQCDSLKEITKKLNISEPTIQKRLLNLEIRKYVREQFLQRLDARADERHRL